MIASTLSPAALTVGLDVGGTKTAVVVTDAAEQLYHTTTVPTDRRRLAAQLAGLVRDAAAAIQGASGGGSLDAVGIATPGHVDTESGTVQLAVNLGADLVALAAPLEGELGIPCFVEHDARAAAIWLFDQARLSGDAPHSLAYLSVGTGIAAGIVVDGVPIRGRRGLAGEIGHVVADPAGPRCACGLRGCLEAVAAGPAIARRARQAARAGGSAMRWQAATTEEVFALAAAGDTLAGRIVAEAAGHLARAIRGLVLGFGVDRVVVGGGVAGAGEALREPLLAALAQERQASPLVEEALSEASIELLPPESAAGARGAALVARNALASRLTAVAAGGRG